jgi:peptidase M28-like protein
MSKVRRVALAAGLVLAVAAAVAIPSSAAPTRGKARSSNDHPHGPSPALRSMLREIDARNVERDIRTLASFGTRHTLSSQTDPNRGIGAARDWIYDQFTSYAAASGGRMTVQKQSFVQPPGPRNPQPVTVTNLVATLRGTQPESADRVYVVSGHYDSRCTDVLNFTCDAPGADDDASGVAAVLELARVMAKRQFDATIVFMAVAGEEQGLYGSTFFAQQAKAAGMDVQGMFTNDIIGSSTSDKGRRDPFTVRLFSEGVPTAETPQQAALRQSIGGENDGPSRQLARYVKEVGENSATGMHVRLVWRRDRYLRGGDQIPFLQQGYPAARFTESAEDFAHQHQGVRVEDGKQFGDLPEFVDFAYTARVARVNGAALANLAWAPTAPKNATIDTTQLTNDTTLNWNANAEPDLAGYEIVWRESTAPLWEHTIPVGNVTRFTIPDLSKDNVQLGVRAVDRDGYRSPVAFPVPGS